MYTSSGSNSAIFFLESILYAVIFQMKEFAPGWENLFLL